MSPAVLAMAWASWGRMGALRSGFWLKNWVMNSGTGTQMRRICLGSALICSWIFSRIMPGTSHSRAAGLMRLSTVSGRVRVTPSSGWCGSKR